jgi:hypothetical protein
MPKKPSPSKAARLAITPTLKCTCGPIKGKQLTIFENVPVGPGTSFDSGVAHSLDGYRYVNYWLLATHPAARPMDSISLEIVFEFPGKMGATGFLNLEDANERGAIPQPLIAASGSPGAYGGFVVRVPVIGPGARAIVINNGPGTYDFSVYAYATA